MSKNILKPIPLLILCLIFGVSSLQAEGEKIGEGARLISISAGFDHTCGLKNDGTVTCWGFNDYGQATAPAGTFTQISGAYTHTCGLKSDHTVACWGWDIVGQITPPANTFTQISSSPGFNCGVKTNGNVVCWGNNNNGQGVPPADTFIQVSTGDTHTCGLKNDRTVVCWGANNKGQLNAPAGTFTQISSRASHNCGVKSDGSIACWGENVYGESSPPTGTFTQVSTGLYHTCGVRNTGTVDCWGNSLFNRTNAPTGMFIQISAGASHTCAVKSDGSIVCWGQGMGSNYPPYGVVFAQPGLSAGGYHTCKLQGDGSVTCWGHNNESQSSPPITTTFTQIGAGGDHNCGVKSDGSAVCWGRNGSGTGQSSPPAGTFTQIRGGRYHTCGLKSDGSITCWGENNHGQSSNIPSGTFIQIEAGDWHTCGIKSNGSAACWGYNFYGQSSHTPGGTFTQISGGDWHTCGVRSNGSAACWGKNDFGQSTPPGGTFIQVSAGGDHSCGIKSDGTVTCWGKNDFGQSTPPGGTFTQISAGDSHVCTIDNYTNVTCWGKNDFGQSTAPGGAFTQISAGDAHVCGVKSNGSAVCWGKNDYGQTNPYLDMFTQISSGTNHNCGVKNNGSVSCWGYNGNGESNPPTGTFTQISAGNAYTCGLNSDGTAACWGYNSVGQTNVPTDTFTQISAGYYHGCGVKSDGTTACWGNDDFGQSSPPTGTFRQISAGGFHACGIKPDRSVACWGLDGDGQSTPPTGEFIQVSSGEIHTCSIKSDGSAICWGDNDDGQSSPPTGTFTSISAGAFHTCGAKNDGSTVCWGRNNYGQSTPQSPTDITLSNTSVVENTSAVGSFSTTDPNTSETFIYTLAAGSSDTDNAKLAITGNQLAFITAANFETQPSYSVRVRSTDPNGMFFEKEFTINVTDVNEFAPILADQSFEVVENSSPFLVVGIVSPATDGDTAQTLSYAVVGGSGQGLFSFNPTTRDITVDGALDFETTTSYTLDIEVTDSGTPSQSDTATMTINVTDENEFAPVLADQNFSIAENSSAGTVVGTVNAATDGDTAQTLSNQVTGGTGQTLFDFNTATREITVNGALDYETNTNYVLIIEVTDNGEPSQSAAGSIILNLTDVNEAPELANQTFSITENTDIGTVIATITAADEDTAQTLTYQVTGGTGQALFDFNPINNEITVNGVLDYETATSYTLDIEVTDSGTPALSDTATMTINVTDENEFAPVLADQTFNIAENTSIGTVVGTIIASDQDTAQTLSYDFAGTSWFDFNPATGEFTVNRTLDYEAATGFQFRVDVTDNGTPPKSTTAWITVNLIDVNEFAPELDDQTFTVAENSSVVATISPAVDGDTLQLLYYSIVGGTGQAIFSIDQFTRVITVNGVLDYETATSYTLDIQVTDSGTPSQSDTATMTINLTDENEFAPVLADQNFSIAENSSIGTSVGTINAATDGDTAQTLSYQVTGGTGQTLFDFNTATREITVNGALDYETNTSYTLDIQVTDSGTPPQSTTAIVTLNLTDVNEAPELANQTFSIAENSSPGTIVGTVSPATDVDTAQTLSYQVTGGTGQDMFYFNLTTRQLTVNTAPDYETTTSYTLDIQVTDSGTPSQYDVATMTINITDQNEFAPVLSNQTFSTAENSSIGTVVGIVNAATDGDTGQTLSYQVVGGTGQALFDFNAVTREITVNGALDYETSTFYTLNIRATDSGTPSQSTTNPVILYLRDVNEFAPDLLDQNFTAEENSTAGTVVGTVSFATDGDTAQLLSYTMVGGTGQTLFDFNTATREITVNGALDYEISASYTLDIQVTDSGTPSQSDIATMIINITDENEAAPVFADQSFDIAENSGTGTVVGIINGASDEDSGQTFSYQVVGGTGQVLFDFNPVTLEIKVNGVLDYETSTNYTLGIQVSDSGTPSLSTGATITINVTDVDETTATLTPEPATATSTPEAPTATSTAQVATATITPVIATATNTPEIQGRELLINGGFEIDLVSPLKQPDNWTLTGKSMDKLKCNTVTAIVAFEGLCAYAFKGTAGENAKLSQKLNITLPTFVANDILTMSIHYKTGASAPKLKVKVRVFYTDTTLPVGKLNETINTVSSSYTQRILTPYPLIDKNVLKIKVQFQNKATSGKIYIDAASLMLTNLR